MSAPTFAAPTHTTPPSDRLLSLQDAASYLDVHERTVRQYIADGAIPAFRLPGKSGNSRLIRIRLSDLDAAMKPVGGVRA